MQTRNLLNGQWVDALSGREFPVRNPATDEEIARVPDGDAADARRAIESCARAYPAWRALAAAERSRPLRRLADFMMRDQERLARLMTGEQGKPLVESRGEVAYAASFLEWSAEEAKRLYGETIPAGSASKRILVLREPVGVCAAITPWNFPAAMITRKLGPALACGCTMVVKPPEATPLSAIAIGELAVEAGLPPGVFNIVTGDAKTIGGEFLANPVVRKLSFTGSTEVGKLLVKGAAQNLTRLSLELGGHAPCIVFDDADMPRAVAGAIASKFRNAGQTCICANRILVHEPVYDRFAAELAKEVGKLRVGPGAQDGVQIGPLIDDDAMTKVRTHVDDAVAKGATVRLGGAPAKVAPGLAQRFYSPTILEGCTPDMLCWQEETFGPVMPMAVFRDEDEALAMANDTPYGLAAYFYSQDASRIVRIMEGLDYGIVGVNDALPSTAQAPFGGMKQSGWGREGGKYAMDAYTEIKYVSWGV